MANDLNTYFSALSDQTRRSVIEKLVHGPATVSDLASDYDMALPTFMRHLKVLEDCHLVRSTKKGRVRTCSMNAGPMLEIQGWLAWQRNLWESRLDNLSALADDIDRSN